MTQALFYVMPSTPDTNPSTMEPVYHLCCRLAKDAFLAQQRVYIHCQDQEQAFEIDEILWKFEPQSFVPHNLKGEGPDAGAPVEIGFDKLGSDSKRYLLINLAEQVPDFAVNFEQIIDFVADNPAKKTEARARYRQYGQLAITLTTKNV